MEGLDFASVFTIPTAAIPFLAALFPEGIAISETLVVSWLVMLLLIAFSIIVTRKLKEKPEGFQNIIEAAVDALNGFAKNEFGGRWAGFLGSYMGTLFLFLLAANIIGCVSPIEFSFMGVLYEPPFEIKPPARDISFTVPLAALTVLMTIFFAFAAKGPRGWAKSLVSPVPMMLPFNILEYGTRLLSLSLRLFGNILGGLVIMQLIARLLPVGVPMIASLYFDFFDGLLQAAIFVFLSCLYIAEACKPAHG
jgi:F-type H+-transporting ATPase subunit a